MKSSSIVLLQGDPLVAQRLVSLLNQVFQSVYVASSLQDALSHAAKRRAEALIVDLELIGLNDLAALTNELPHVRTVGNHRLADEKLWLAALNAGAADCCASSDPKAIVNAALGRPTLSAVA
jgi:DNA-binding NarL/FixJ family response regulator